MQRIFWRGLSVMKALPLLKNQFNSGTVLIGQACKKLSLWVYFCCKYAARRKRRLMLMLKKLVWGVSMALVAAALPMGMFAEDAENAENGYEEYGFENGYEYEEYGLEYGLEDGYGYEDYEDYEDFTLIPTYPAEAPQLLPPQPLPAYIFGEMADHYVTGPQFGIFVDRYGGTLWFDGDFIMPELGAFPLDDDTVLVPFRDVVEGLLAGRVYWDVAGRHVTATVGGTVVGFSLDGASIPVVIINDRIYVPAEAIEEFFLAE
jgi:hypothetical protein